MRWETRRVRKGLTPDELGDLVELVLVAVLATYRRDGSVLLSPVWHEWHDDGFNVVTGSLDVKAGHLRRDPHASIVVYEHDPPYRGLELCVRARSAANAAVDQRAGMSPEGGGTECPTIRGPRGRRFQGAPLDVSLWHDA
jgi:Pyridoxamine 5'-phosphate oxidase